MHTEYCLNRFSDLSQETKKPLTKRLTVSFQHRQTEYYRFISFCVFVFIVSFFQYTCVDVSNYIVFGASSGSLYIFRRYPCEFLQLIQNVHGSITNVRISPNERYVIQLVIRIFSSLCSLYRFIGFSTDKGTIGVYLLDFEAQEPIIITSQCEETKNITFIEWKNEEQHLFIGNKKGVVSIVFIDTLFVSSLNKIFAELWYNFKNICRIEHWPVSASIQFYIWNRR